MSKDAIMIAIDAGNSMDQPFSENASRLKIAMQCFKLTLQQKIFNNATHQIGFSLFGDNQSDDGNNCELQPLARPTLDLVRKVVSLSETQLKNDKPGGDIFNAIEFVIGKIASHCQKKKYNKRAFIFTNGMGQTTSTVKRLDKIVNELRQNQIKLNIICLDFMENYDVEENALEGEGMMEGNQQTNAMMLMKLRSLQMENVQIFPGSLAIELYKKFRKRDVNPIALFKGNLQIAPGLFIEVSTYKGIRRQKLKSLQKYDITQPWSPKIPDTKQIINDVSYTVEGDETGAVVDKQNQTNAYPYGPNYIPVSSMMEAGSKIFEEKNFKLLGFVDKSKIPRHCLMGQADIVIPSENPVSRKLFSSFIYSMISLNRYAIGRYVPRNNKNGVTPKLVVLMPYRTPERQLFYLIELPTAEDIRQYPFNGLKQSTQKHKQLVKQLVQKMSLYHNVDGEEVEEVKIQNTFNPVHQYFYQTVFYRAIHNENQTPDLDPVIKRYITPEEKKYEQTEELMKNMKKEFKFNKKQLASEKAKEKKAVVWKDILTTEQRPIDTLSMADTELEEPLLVGKKFNFEQDDATDHIDPNAPVASFRKMLTNNHRDLVDTALKEMVQLIEQKASTAISKQDVKNIVQLASTLRFGCIEQRQTNFWDDWLENSSAKIGEQTFKRLIAEGLGFINKNNESIYKAEELHPMVEEEYDQLD